MVLLVDDMRNYGADIIARTYMAGLAVLETGKITVLLLDHDLGGNLTGYDLLKDAKNYLPSKVTLVTQNPVGLKNMQNRLLDYGYKQESPIIFLKG
jgi:hypothetical protein